MATIVKPHLDWICLLVTLTCVTIRHVQCATQAEERSSEKVKIKMYDLSTSGWTTSKRNTFSTVIASEATDYCNASPSSCGLDAGATFAQGDVGTSSADKDGSSIEFTFYIDYPAGASVSAGGDTAFVVPSTAAQAIAAAARDEVKDDVGHYITYIEDDYYSIPPNTDTNRVIIPVAFVVVFLLAVTVVALHYYQKNKERKAKIAERLTRKKMQKQGGGVGVNASYSALDTTTTTILTANNSATPRRGYNNNFNNNNNYNNNMKVSTRDNLTNDAFAEHDSGPVVVSAKALYTSPSAARRSRPMTAGSVNEFHDGQVVLGDEVTTPASLPKNKVVEKMSMMETLEDDEARRERKRRRKEKRRERKRREEEEGGDRVMETSYENPVFNSSNLSEGTTYSYH